MSLFAANAHICSLLLEGQGRPITVDIALDRWSSVQQLDEAVLGVLATMHTSPPSIGASWAHCRSYWQNGPIVHPDFTLLPGAISSHKGPPLPGFSTIAITDGHVVLPTGRRIAQQTFSVREFHPIKAKQAHGRLAGIPTHDTTQPTRLDDPKAPHVRVFFGATLGVLAALEGRPYWDNLHTNHGDWGPLDLVGRVVGALARMHAAFPRTGKEAKQWGQEAGKDQARSLLDCWALRPDRAYSAQHWTRGAPWHTYAAGVLAQDLAAGEAAARAILEMAGSLDRLARLNMPTTAHDKVLAKAIDAVAEQALLAAYARQPDHLKPRAAAKADALA